MFRVEESETEFVRGGLSESGELRWSAENVRQRKFVCSDAMIRVSVICV